jgi:DNA-binding Lrp family transcriptional regulator
LPRKELRAALAPNVTLDARDLAILRALVRDPRSSLRDIVASVEAAGLAISAETVRRRLAVLAKVVPFQPVPDLAALGLDCAMLLVRLRSGGRDRAKVVQRIHRWRPIEMFETTGRYDLAVRVPVERPGDLAAAVQDLRGMDEVVDVEYVLVGKVLAASAEWLLGSGPAGRARAPSKG